MDIKASAQRSSRVEPKQGATSSNLLPRPTAAAERKKWEKIFQKVARLATMILKSGDKVDQKEVRAGMLLHDLAESGFVDEAMTAGAGLKGASEKGEVYKAALEQPGALSEAHLKTIADHFVDPKKSLSDHPLMKKLRDKSGDYSRELGTAKLQAGLSIFIASYPNDPALIPALAEILIFNPGFRPPFSKWMWAQSKGELLFQILQSKYFVEPGYGPTVFSGHELEMDKDMPWVYANKQQYYVDYLIDLGVKAKVTIPKPKKMKIEQLRAWLDANTELIGQALSTLYPTEPGKITKVYQEIADVFFFHIDHDKNVEPDPTGKLAKLKPGDPDKMRLQADCDVFATYALRLLNSAGFTPVGYMFVFPTGENAARSAHAVALAEKTKIYYGVSNKAVSSFAAKDLASAQIELKKLAMNEYAPALKSYEVYYGAAGDKGALPKALSTQDASLRRKDLEP